MHPNTQTNTSTSTRSPSPVLGNSTSGKSTLQPCHGGKAVSPHAGGECTHTHAHSKESTHAVQVLRAQSGCAGFDLCIQVTNGNSIRINCEGSCYTGDTYSLGTGFITYSSPGSPYTRLTLGG